MDSIGPLRDAFLSALCRVSHRARISALTDAAAENDTAGIERLLKLGTDVGANDHYALTMAAAFGHEAAVEALISYCGSPSALEHSIAAASRNGEHKVAALIRARLPARPPSVKS